MQAAVVVPHGVPLGVQRLHVVVVQRGGGKAGQPDRVGRDESGNARLASQRGRGAVDTSESDAAVVVQDRLAFVSPRAVACTSEMAGPEMLTLAVAVKVTAGLASW